MPYRSVLALLLIAGCSTPRLTTAPVPMRTQTGPARQVQAAQDRQLAFTVVAEGEAPQVGQATVQAIRSGPDVYKAWDSIPFYSKDKSLCPTKIAKLDFGEQTVYLIGIPYDRFTDDPVIDSVTENTGEVLVRYHTTRRGQVELPATKTHYLAVAIPATDKPVRLERTDP